MGGRGMRLGLLFGQVEPGCWRRRRDGGGGLGILLLLHCWRGVASFCSLGSKSLMSSANFDTCAQDITGVGTGCRGAS